jgi:hypothetical protein
LEGVLKSAIASVKIVGSQAEISRSKMLKPTREVCPLNRDVE